MKKHRNDLILLLCLLAVALVAFAATVLTRTEGAAVLVTVDGKTVSVYPLSENTKIRIGDEQHGNTLVIKDGKAYIKDATCPDKTCEKQKHISYSGESIVCLPNKTVISIKSTDEPEVDFVQ